MTSQKQLFLKTVIIQPGKGQRLIPGPLRTIRVSSKDFLPISGPKGWGSCEMIGGDGVPSRLPEALRRFISDSLFVIGRNR
jgi:hypothetical protein